MIRRDNLVPSSLEAVLYAVVTGVIIFLGSFRFLTGFLTRDAATPGGFLQQAGGELDRLLGFFDNLAFTPGMAVFLFWSLIGIIAFSFVQSLLNMYAEIQEDIDVSGRRFLHPRNFVRSDFWLQLLLQALVRSGLFVLLLLVGFAVGAMLMPLAVSSLQALFDSFNVATLVGFMAAFVLLYIGVVVLALILKLFLRRKRAVL